MTNKEVYRIWAPPKKKWVDWVRPVPFIGISKYKKQYMPTNVKMPYLSSLKKNDKSMAIIVDLPSIQSVDVGLFLAKECGFRPIPIYNGTIEQKGARATTDNTFISYALSGGAMVLQGISLDDNAAPTFLTDKNRLQRHKIDNSVFDNSWDVYHQDLPTEDYFIENGITKILVVSDELSKDLKKIFMGYPKKKVAIYITNGYEEPKCFRKGKQD